MIALRPFSKKIGNTNISVKEGKELPKILLDFCSSKELQELKDKKIIGDSVKVEQKPEQKPEQKSEQKPYNNNHNNNRKDK